MERWWVGENKGKLQTAKNRRGRRQSCLCTIELMVLRARKKKAYTKFDDDENMRRKGEFEL